MTKVVVGLLLALGMVAIWAAWAWLLSRDAGRRHRKRHRAAIGVFRGSIDAFFAGELTAPQLRSAAREVSDLVFWSALERYGNARRAERRALGETLERIGHVRRERRALREGTPWRSELAARRAGILAGPRNRRALHGALRSGPRLVAMAAARALARRRDLRALRWLLAHAEHLPTRNPRTLAALFRVFGRGACGDLANTLERSAHEPAVLTAMLNVLGSWRHRDAADVCARKIVSESMEVRVAAIRALGEMASTRHAPAAVALLGDPAWPVRAQAARALGRMGAPSVVPVLAESTCDRAWWVRRHAAYALGQLGEPGRAALTAIRDRSPDPYAREMADEVLRGGFLRRTGS